MPYRLLADAAVLVHLCWIVFLCIGVLWGRKYTSIKIVHLGALGFALVSTAFNWICPLTHLEVWLRGKQDPALTYTGSFIIHYAEKIIYPDISGTVIFMGTTVLVGINGWLYRKWRP